MNSFVAAVKNTPVLARTENGMKAIQSTLNSNVDLFYKIGASRGKDIIPDFEKAFQEDSELAVRIAQWARDVRGGAGERQLFRDILLWLEKQHSDILLDTLLLRNIAQIGRFDDLLIFETLPVQKVAFKLIAEALSARNGLCAKWLPRKGKLAAELRSFLGLSPKTYRKLLVQLTNVVETPMCAKQWNQINFEHVPSLALSRYSKAFNKRTPDTFSAFKSAVVKGEAKINASAVYPYDVTKNVFNGDEKLADIQWEALPNYMNGQYVLPMVDVSGSMTSPIGSKTGSLSALDVAVSLGLYTSGKNTGPYKDLFLTFSGSPELVKVSGTLSQRMRQMSTSKWEMNTNLHRAFELILNTAVNNNVNAADMPKVLLILSDMQFDSCIRHDDSAMEMIRCKYTQAGYSTPAIIFWNINSYSNAPVKFNDIGAALVSGFSPAIMKAVLSAELETITPEGIMNKTILIDRYTFR